MAALLAPRPALSYSLKELLDNRLDPELRYRTLETPHFSIHYPEDLEEVAGRISPIAESAHERVTAALRSEPQGRTHSPPAPAAWAGEDIRREGVKELVQSSSHLTPFSVYQRRLSLHCHPEDSHVDH